MMYQKPKISTVTIDYHNKAPVAYHVILPAANLSTSLTAWAISIAELRFGYWLFKNKNQKKTVIELYQEFEVIERHDFTQHLNGRFLSIFGNTFYSYKAYKGICTGEISIKSPHRYYSSKFNNDLGGAIFHSSYRSAKFEYLDIPRLEELQQLARTKVSVSDLIGHYKTYTQSRKITAPYIAGIIADSLLVKFKKAGIINCSVNIFAV